MEWADVGGTPPTIKQPNIGRSQVSFGVMTFFGAISGTTLMAHDISGEPGIDAFRNGVVLAVLALSVGGGLVTRVDVVADQHNLAHVKRVLNRE